jgi:hypothetical protein
MTKQHALLYRPDPEYDGQQKSDQKRHDLNSGVANGEGRVEDQR